MTSWNILYRGSLSSCNYACNYCPFAKTGNTRAELATDRRELERFVDWIETRAEPLGILFTPWGEALGHRYYRRALVRLSKLPTVRRVAIQTNLSAPTNDLLAAGPSLALWTTFHPSQTSLDRFISRCRGLDAAGIRYSVGVVGLKHHFEAIERLRERLISGVYLWINAYKRAADYYSPQEVERLSRVDPYFHLNLHRYPSAHRACRAGESTFTVDGRGDIRRCHFVSEVIGNVYAADFEQCLRPRSCPQASCGCHIGYVHRPELELDRLFGEGLLERIPALWPDTQTRFAFEHKSSSSLP